MRLHVMVLAGLVAIGGAGAYSWSKDTGGANATAGLSAGSTPATAAAGAPATDPVYQFTTVRFPGSLDSTISGINAAGAYTGNLVEKTRYAIFEDSGRPGAKPVFLTLPFAAVARSVQTAGIDSAGEVVGNYADKVGVFHGWVRSPSGAFTRLDIPGAGTQKGEGTEVAGISPGGVIVGSFIGLDKVASGFIDRGGHSTPVVEKSGGHQPGDGTAVEFYLRGEYGGIYVGPGRGAHGWYVKNGTTHVINDPAAGRPEANKGTQLVGVDGTGRLYGIVSPDTGTTESFSFAGGRFVPVIDPRQARGANAGTLVLGVNPSGTVVGFYTYNAKQTHGFIGRPRP